MPALAAAAFLSVPPHCSLHSDSLRLSDSNLGAFSTDQLGFLAVGGRNFVDFIFLREKKEGGDGGGGSIRGQQDTVN
jgi:hypothetical protein